MTAQLTILASGSSGNASLLELDDFGLLIDGGLGPKQLATRLRLVGRSWDDVHAMILTHTHGDHWSLRTLQQMAHRRRPVYMHAGHQRNLQTSCPAIALLRAANVLRTYDHDQWLTLGPGLRCLPSEVQHDGGPTFGFRFEAGGDLFHKAWAAAYFCDLGLRGCSCCRVGGRCRRAGFGVQPRCRASEEQRPASDAHRTLSWRRRPSVERAGSGIASTCLKPFMPRAAASSCPASSQPAVQSSLTRETSGAGRDRTPRRRSRGPHRLAARADADAHLRRNVVLTA